MNINDLQENQHILVRCISGSKAYGLDTPQSDTDIRGVFILPKNTFYSTQYFEQISDIKNDITYYELRRFIELLSKNNPNILELLNIPEDCLLFKHFLFEKLKKIQVLSKLCQHTFAGYAMTQIKKARGLNKKILNPVDEVRKSILDFCYVTHHQGSIPLKTWLKTKVFTQENCGLVNIAHMKNLYALFYDPNQKLGYRGVIKSDQAQDVALSSVPKEENPVAYLYFNLEGYSSYCKDYKAYWDWVEKRNEVRYENTLSHGKNYDSKNMMHTFRLLDMAAEIALEGRIKVRRPNREFLFKIRGGAFEYEDLLKMAEEKALKLEEDYAQSSLPEKPDLESLESVLVEIREEFYQG